MRHIRWPDVAVGKDEAAFYGARTAAAGPSLIGRSKASVCDPMVGVACSCV